MLVELLFGGTPYPPTFSKNENYSKYLESMESILDDKDERVREILFKTNTNII